MLNKEENTMSIITENEREYLLRSMRNLFDEYDYEWRSNAIDKIIDEWATKKADLIQTFKNHPNYVEGQFMIAFDTDYERIVNKNASNAFSYYLTDPINMDRIHSLLPPEMEQQRIEDSCAFLPDKVYRFLDNLADIAQRTLSEETAIQINEMMPNVHAHPGEKTSRVINKICTYLGYAKLDDYNKEFAKYADSLSPLKITRHTVLSINPLDYLTMSFGNSWASCHTIDKSNKRGMPNSYEGQYSSGTMSYMLDRVSMVFYTVDSSYDGQVYWNEAKITRQMFHYGEEKLIQGRLYPQSNDGDSTEYTINRNIVQKIIADIYGFPNLWTIKRGNSPIREYVFSDGTHYTDYYYFADCSISRPKETENESSFTIGALPICIECGGFHNINESINCCTIQNATVCEDCGCTIRDEDDVIWVNGYSYCRDCVEYCDICEEYHRRESYYIQRDDIHVCEDCVGEYYHYCFECGEYVHRDDAIWCECEDEYICPECYSDKYETCSECGEVFPSDDMYDRGDERVCSDCYDALTENEEEAC